MKRIFSAIAVLAIVSGALAFKATTHFNAGTVYCNSLCPVNSLTHFVESDQGTILTPCGTGIQPYTKVGSPAVCTPTPTGQKFLNNFPGK